LKIKKNKHLKFFIYQRLFSEAEPVRRKFYINFIIAARPFAIVLLF